MTLAKHNHHTAAAIPSHLSPNDVIKAMHDHNTCLSLQALTTSHEKLPFTDPATLTDPYWYPIDQYPTSTYRVTEIITYLPFSWSKYELTFPSCFQNTPNGLKTRVDTSGVILRAEYRVVEGSKVEGVVEGGIGNADWVLVEDVEVRCPWWMMPLVRGKMEEAHKDICRKVVEKAVAEKEHGPAENIAAKGEIDAQVPLESFHGGKVTDSPIKTNA